MKIGIIGPESSGKTTLAINLSNIYNGNYIEEFARKYLYNKGLDYKYKLEDLEIIAKEQFNYIQQCINEEIYFIDTELITIQIWAEDKFNFCPNSISKLVETQKLDALILCKPDFPWESDPLREDAFRQDIIFEMYLNMLTLNKLPYLCAQGSLDKRLEDCIFFLKGLNLFPAPDSNH